MSIRRKGKITVKDENGVCYQVDQMDPRWTTRKLVGVNKNNLGVSNKNNKLTGYFQAKDESGKCFRVRKDDPRWIRNELVGINKGRPASQTTIDAAKARKGIPKTAEHNKKNSDAIKQLKWYANFTTNEIKRFKENEHPDGFVRVSGPHKKVILNV